MNHQSTAATTDAPVAGWAVGPLRVVQEADREIARWTAVRARAIAEFAEARPASVDRQPGEPGAMSADRRAARPEVLAEVSEWAVQELAIARSTSREAAGRRLEQSMTLVHRLPGTLAALESGLIHDGHLFTMLERVAAVADDTERARLERDVLAWVAARAAKRQITTPPQLADKARRMGLGRDPKQEAADLVRALRARGAWVRPDRRAGMAVLEALLTAPQAQAVVDALGRYADALPDDPADRRTRGERMADILLDLVLRPGESPLPPVQAQLTLVAGVRALLGGSAPGQVGGDVVPAEMVRALARALGLLGVTVPGAAREATPDTAGGSAAAAGGSWDPNGTPDETWPSHARADFDRWEDEIDDRARAGAWGGEDDPPPEVQLRWWEEEDRRSAHEHPDVAESETGNHDDATDHSASTCEDDGDRAETERPHSPPPSEGVPAAARAAAEQAGLALLQLDQALRRAAAAAGRARLDDHADEQAAHADGAQLIDTAATDLDALHAATAERRAELAALLERTAGGTLVDRPRIAVVDELTGALLALTDARELRRLSHCGRPACARRPERCDHDLTGRPGLGPPPPTDGYRPATALDRYLRARDARCRFPGCRRRIPAGGELDHHTPWPHGPTSADNLVGYCTGHHRGKHQAPGWRHHLAGDGTLTVTTPTGLVASTAPPPF